MQKFLRLLFSPRLSDRPTDRSPQLRSTFLPYKERLQYSAKMSSLGCVNSPPPPEGARCGITQPSHFLAKNCRASAERGRLLLSPSFLSFLLYLFFLTTLPSRSASAVGFLHAILTVASRGVISGYIPLRESLVFSPLAVPFLLSSPVVKFAERNSFACILHRGAARTYDCTTSSCSACAIF